MTAAVVTLVATKQENSIANFASGSFSTDAGTAADYNIYTGFKPRYVRVMNITDILMYEWYDGDANPSAFLTTGSTGAVTHSATEAAGITVLGAGAVGDTAVSRVADPGLIVSSPAEHTNSQGGVIGNGFTLDEDIMVASKSFVWFAIG